MLVLLHFDPPGRTTFNDLAEWDGRARRCVMLHFADLASMNGGYTSTAKGRLVFGIFASIAEIGRSLIVERVKAGMRNARAKGKRIGRPPRTYLTQQERRAIAEAYRQGLGSLRQLAARFGTSVGTIQRSITAR